MVEFALVGSRSSPDVELRFESLAGDEESIVVRQAGHGHAAAEAAAARWSTSTTAVVTFRDGRHVRADLFDAGDEAAALARYEELRRASAGSSPADRAEWPATSRELHERFVAGYNERDWDALRELFAPDVRFVDRRLVGWGELEGPDTYVELLQGGVALARDVRLDRRAAGARPARRGRPLSGRGHLEAGGGEFELEYVSLSLVEDGLVTYVEVFDGD